MPVSVTDTPRKEKWKTRRRKKGKEMKDSCRKKGRNKRENWRRKLIVYIEYIQKLHPNVKIEH